MRGGTRARQEAQVSAACDRQGPRADPQRRGRVLEDAAIFAEFEPHDASLEVGDPVAWMSHREDRGVVLETFLGEHRERPGGVARDREARRAEAHRTEPGGVLDRDPRAAQVGAKLLRSLVSEHPVCIAVTRDLVIVLRDLPQQLRMSLGHPTEREERCARTGCGEKVEQPVRRALDARGHAIPLARRDHILEVRDLEVLLEIHAQRA
jgi:hypothetical protein